jgi:hypothetical protein
MTKKRRPSGRCFFSPEGAKNRRVRLGAPFFALNSTKKPVRQGAPYTLELNSIRA